MKRILLFSIISLVIMEGVVWIIFGEKDRNDATIRINANDTNHANP
mgnify:CR=1 FL=1